MKVEIISVSGIDLFTATIKKSLKDKSESDVRSEIGVKKNSVNQGAALVVETHSVAILGAYDRNTIALGHHKGASIVNRGMGIIHLNAIVTATPSWFKRAGVSYYPATTNEDGTITAGVSLSYYRLFGLFHDEDLFDNEEWDDFFGTVEDIPLYDLLISMDSPEYETLESND